LVVLVHAPSFLASLSSSLPRPPRATLFPYTTLFRSQERQVGELRTLAGGEVVLGAGTQLGDPREVHLDGRGQLGHLVERLHHPLADDLADARHLLLGAAL